MENQNKLAGDIPPAKSNTAIRPIFSGSRPRNSYSLKAILLLTGFLLLIPSKAFPQKWIKIDTVFNPMGVSVTNFSGPFFADIDHDGDPDLFLGGNGMRLEYFENVSTTGRTAFRKDTNLLAPIYAGGYQFTNHDYPALCDLDGDKDFDLIIGGYNGILYYENVGTQSAPSFTQKTGIFDSVNTKIGSDARPAFVDIDGDGDLDLFVGIGESLISGPTPGITMAFRNIGNNREPAFVLDNTLVSGIADVGLNSFPAFADLNHDGKFDLLIGRDLQSFVYYQNNGTAQAPVWQANSSIFSGVETSHYWKDPVLYDFDNDGDFDLIYGTDSGTLYFYQNNGTPSSPSYQLNNSMFTAIKSPANAATVSLADYDKDGDMDFISGDWLGKFQYFRNDGTKYSPAFKLTTTTFSALNVSSYSAPVFIDLDKDGDIDIVTGRLNGQLTLFVNNNGAFSANSTFFSQVAVGYSSIPTFGDINGDGNPDLLVGAEASANVIFLENKGSNVFQRNDTLLNGVVFPNYCRPVFADVDNDGDIDLVIGRSDGSMKYYENKGSKTTPVWTLNDLIFAGVEVDQNASPGFADMDNDGRPDMIIGEYNGNFTYYKNTFAISGVDDINQNMPDNFVLQQNYPNPFNPATTIHYELPAAELHSSNERVTLRIFDLLGNGVETLIDQYQPAGTYSVSWNAARYPSGVYFYELRVGSRHIVKKMTLIK